MFLCRFWLFSDVVPGLYIEKGWVHESIDYSFTPPPEEKPAEPEVEEEEDGEAAPAPDSQGKQKYILLKNVCFSLDLIMQIFLLTDIELLFFSSSFCLVLFALCAGLFAHNW